MLKINESTEINKKYKGQKKSDIQKNQRNEKLEKFLKFEMKQQEKLKKTIENNRLLLSKKFIEAHKKIKLDYETIQTKNELKMLKQYNKKLNQEKRKIMGYKQTKSDLKPKGKSIKNMKKKAYTEFQRYCVESRRDTHLNLVYLVDKLKRVKLDEAVGGHIYSKHNYPHIAFDINNCRPINAWTNKIQGTLCGLPIFGEGVEQFIGEIGIEELKEKAIDKNLKEEYIKKQGEYFYWESQYNHRKDKRNKLWN